MVTEPSNADIAVMSFEDALTQLEKIVDALERATCRWKSPFASMSVAKP